MAIRDKIMNIETLKKFCTKERPALENPFYCEPYTYATNSRIIIRIREKFDCPVSKHNPPIVINLPWEKLKENKEWLTIKKSDILQKRDNDKCEQCSPDATKMPEKCRGCRDGYDGYYWDTTECDRCEGTGYEDTNPIFPVSSCPNCFGTQVKNYQEKYLLFDNICLSFGLLVSMVQNLGDIKLLINYKKYSNPIPFKFSDGEGLVMSGGFN